MHRTIDTRRRQLCAAVCVGGLGGLSLASARAAAAVAEDLPPMPDDDFNEAQQLQQDGKAWHAQAILRQWAQAGYVVAMERLALMHWYGRILYPGQAWSRELAVHWFGQAAERGSELGRHMSLVARQQR